MDLIISSVLVQQMLLEAEASPGREVCGLLLGKGRQVIAILPTYNVARDPDKEFEVDPAQLISAHKNERAGGPKVIGHYHSHPNGLSEPSKTDQAMIRSAGEIWIIVANKQARAFAASDDKASFAEIAFNTLES